LESETRLVFFEPSLSHFSAFAFALNVVPAGMLLMREIKGRKMK
jgi:hypothetical protein